ncbi:MAG: flavin reductase family protein [Lutibacter sp.]|jgi:flavin reductase (DIM6/NTAB) family NADH-FMN oxidoreductase RutF
MLSIDPNDISTVKLHEYLLSAVAPRPIAFASTLDAFGNPNLSPFSYFNVFSANPPILIFSPARRVRGNTTKHTFENAKATKEVVINVVNYDIIHQVSLASSLYPQGVNEFLKAGFTMLASEKVKPFRVAESPVQFECKVKEIVELGIEGGAGNLIICEVVKMHIKKEYLDKEGAIDQYKLDLVARAGGSLYSRMREGFFEIPKPLSTPGIGVDVLPFEIRNSNILSGNDLGMLANVEVIPSEVDVDKFAKEHPEYVGINTVKKHIFAKALLEKDEVLSAWKMLLMK